MFSQRRRYTSRVAWRVGFGVGREFSKKEDSIREPVGLLEATHRKEGMPMQQQQTVTSI
jgi:hypothetical protein